MFSTFSLTPSKIPDGSRVVVHPPSSLNSSLNDSRAGDEVVGETVVETALELEEVLSILEEGHVAVRECLEGLLVGMGVTDGGGARDGGDLEGRAGCKAEDGRI